MTHTELRTNPNQRVEHSAYNGFFFDCVHMLGTMAVTFPRFRMQSTCGTSIHRPNRYTKSPVWMEGGFHNSMRSCPIMPAEKLFAMRSQICRLQDSSFKQLARGEIQK